MYQYISLTISGAQTPIRLMDGDKTVLQKQKKEAVTGRVEVEYGNHWGTICDDKFGDDDALVLCTMMNYTFGQVKDATLVLERDICV